MIFMSDHYYGKFDKSNWGWWNPMGRSVVEGSLLDNYLSGIKVYQPAKYLFLFSQKTGFMLISRREQVDTEKDNNRSFYLMHFQMVSDVKNTMQIFAGFKEPKHYSNPDIPTNKELEPANGNQQYVNTCFYLIWEHIILGGKKIFIVNDKVHLPDYNKEEVDHFNFLTFPEAAPVINALSKLPIGLLGGISLLINFENDMLSRSSLLSEELNLVYCFKETVTDTQNKTEKQVDFSRMQDQRFEVFRLSELPEQKVDINFIDFVSTHFNQQTHHAEQIIFDLAITQHVSLSQPQKGAMLHLLYMVDSGMKPDANAPFYVQNYFETKIQNHSSTQSIQPLKEKIIKWYLTHVNSPQLYNDLFKISAYADLLKKRQDILQDLIVANKPDTINQVIDVINSDDFAGLPINIQNTFVAMLGNMAPGWELLLGHNQCLSVQKICFLTLSGNSLNPIWSKPLDNNRFSPDQLIEAAGLLFRATNNKDAFVGFASTQYKGAADFRWLDLARQHRVKIYSEMIDLENTSFQFLVHHNRNVEKYKDTLTIDKQNRIILKEKITSQIPNINTKEDLILACDNIDTIFDKENNNFRLNDRQEGIFLPAMLHVLTNNVESEKLESHLKNGDPFKIRIPFVAVFKAIYRLFPHWLGGDKHKTSLQHVNNIIKISQLSDDEGRRMTKEVINNLAYIFPEGTQHSEADFNAYSVLVKKEFKNKAKIKSLLEEALSKSTTILPISKKKIISIVVVALCILIATFFFTLNYINKKNIDSQKNEVAVPSNDSLDKQSLQQTKRLTPVEINEQDMLVKSTRFLDSILFQNDSNGTNYFVFRGRAKSLEFIKLQFPYTDFTNSSIKKLDTIKGINYWNNFVQLNKDSIRYKINFRNRKQPELSASLPDTLELQKKQ
jgi:hypothetical protein